MQIDGTTNPSEEVKKFTNELVKKLKFLSPSESIQIEIDEKKGTKYIRKSTGEVLAEHYENSNI